MTAAPEERSFEAVETHISWVIFAGDKVFKVKKPVAFDFLDWRSYEARAAACRVEVDLNRRLSPDVYEGVGQFAFPDGRLEPVVVMRRLPSNRSMSRLVSDADTGLPACVAAVAESLARFHERARRGPDVDENCRADRLSELWEDNLAAIRALNPCPIDPDQLDRLHVLAGSYLEGRKVLVDERIRDRRAVDGHGDVLCDNIFCLQDGPRILDCLEFDPKLREADTVADVAFLAMDLERRGRPDLGSALFAEYRRVSGDRWPESWADFWVAYRATVRAKVSGIRGITGDADAAADSRSLVGLAVTHITRAQPRAVLVGGLPGTGKSSVAQGIGAVTGWPVISSDAIRQGTVITGPDRATGRYGEGRYSASAVTANYRELLTAARQHLVRGESVVLDATWSSARHRQEAAVMAGEVAARLVSLECTVPAEIAARRLVTRPPGASEATPQVAAEMAARWEPWPEAAQLDTTGDTDAAVGQAIAVLDERLDERPGPLTRPGK